MREVLEVRLGYQSNWYTLKMDVQREGGGEAGRLGHGYRARERD